MSIELIQNVGQRILTLDGLNTVLSHRVASKSATASLAAICMAEVRSDPS